MKMTQTKTLIPARPKSKLLSVACLSTALLMAAAFNGNAATLTQGEFQTIGHTNGAANSANPGISVTSGSEGYSTGINGLGTGGLDGSFNNTILDYAFYTSGSGLTESLGGAASLIGTPTTSGTNSDVTGFSIWAGSPTAGTPDQDTWARAANVTGSVDISGLSSGSLYMFFGARVGTGDNYEISFTLSGDGQPAVAPVSVTGINDETLDANGQDNAWFVYRVDFADAADYDELTFFYTKTGDSNTARQRFGGVVLTGVPEPGSLALLGLGGLLIGARRRRG